MRKTIEFQPSTNDSALLTRGMSNVYEDLVFTDTHRKFRHQFGPGKTKIRLLPSTAVDNDWLLEIPTLQHANGRHTHPRVGDAQSVYDLAYAYMKEKHPTRLFGKSNKTGIRLLSMPISVCWAVVQDTNGIKLRLVHNSFYDGKYGGETGLGFKIYNQVLSVGKKCNLPGHPLNHLDGTSLLVERIAGTDTKFASYRVSLADDRSPLQPLLDKVSDVEFNALCPLKETIRILEPEVEWRLLAKVVGDGMAAEIRAAQESRDDHEECAAASNVEEAAVVEETAVVEEDYKDFPVKWEI